MKTTLQYDIGQIQIFENYVVAIMNEGITVEPRYNDILAQIAHDYFGNRPFGYITHRKNSYAVNPMVYLKTSTIENLVAFAVVSKDGIRVSNIEVEKRFLKQPLRHFEKLADAEAWINETINKARNNFN